jgi:hypothetical protein
MGEKWRILAKSMLRKRERERRFPFQGGSRLGFKEDCVTYKVVCSFT